MQFFFLNTHTLRYHFMISRIICPRSLFCHNAMQYYYVFCTQSGLTHHKVFEFSCWHRKNAVIYTTETQRSRRNDNYKFHFHIRQSIYDLYYEIALVSLQWKLEFYHLFPIKLKVADFVGKRAPTQLKRGHSEIIITDSIFISSNWWLVLLLLMRCFCLQPNGPGIMKNCIHYKLNFPVLMYMAIKYRSTHQTPSNFLFSTSTFNLINSSNLLPGLWLCFTRVWPCGLHFTPIK